MNRPTLESNEVRILRWVNRAADIDWARKEETVELPKYTESLRQKASLVSAFAFLRELRP